MIWFVVVVLSYYLRMNLIQRMSKSLFMSNSEKVIYSDFRMNRVILRLVKLLIVLLLLILIGIMFVLLIFMYFFLVLLVMQVVRLSVFQFILVNLVRSVCSRRSLRDFLKSFLRVRSRRRVRKIWMRIVIVMRLLRSS